jgi:glutamate racemase
LRNLAPPRGVEARHTAISGTTPTIGVFDSGVGGLSVLRELRPMLSGERLVYIGDSAHVPYGSKSPAFIQGRALQLSRTLIDQHGASVVLVACNTATTHAVELVRATFPTVPIVGMEPGIKPAAAATRTGIVGVLATTSTLAGGRFADLLERTAHGVEVLTQACAGLVEQVEAGDVSGPDTLAMLRRCLEPMLMRGADTVVLGCTHFPFLRAAVQEIAGPSVTVVDTAAAVARQTLRVLGTSPPEGGSTSGPGTVTFLTSGDPIDLWPVFERLWGERVPTVHRIGAE